MHCTARLAEMPDEYLKQMQSTCAEEGAINGGFLLEEMEVLEEAKSIGLPNFLPRAAFFTMLQKKMKSVSLTPFEFVEKTWSYVETMVVAVLTRHSENYPQLLNSTRRAAQNLVATKKQQSVDWVVDAIEMEKMTDYTCNPEYLSLWNKLMSHQKAFMEILNNYSKPSSLSIDGFGRVEVGHLRSKVAVVQEAFDLKMRVTAYWKVVVRRMVDCMALHLMFSVQNLINREMEKEVIGEIVGAKGKGWRRCWRSRRRLPTNGSG